MLRAVGFKVYVHSEYFKDDTDDDVWIPSVQGRGWIIFSSDKRIAKDPLNIRAVLDSKAQVIMTSNNNALPEFWGAAFIIGRMRIARLLENNPGPVFIQIGEHAHEHVQVVKQKLTHPRPPDETKADDPPPDEIRRIDNGSTEDQAEAEAAKEATAGEGTTQGGTPKPEK